MNSSGNTIAVSVGRLLKPYDLVFEQETIDPSAVAADEILVETAFSAISPGTELAAYAGLPPLRPGPVYPRLVGYCNCGKVLAAGAKAGNLRVGDRVLTGASHRSHYRIAASSAVRVPDGLESQEAATAYLFHLGYAALQRGKAQAGHRIAVIGLGVLGLATVALARVAGARVTAVSERETALGMASTFGADVAVGKEGAASHADHDIVVLTSNTWDDWKLALRMARRGGTIVVIGFPGRGQEAPAFNPLDSQYFYDKQLALLAAGQVVEADVSADVAEFTLNRNMTYLLDLMAHRRLPAAEFARHIRQASDLAAAYEDLLHRRDDALTYVLRW